MTLPDELSEKHTKSFLEHLEDLRRTLIACAACLAVGLAIAIPLAPHILELLKIPVTLAGQDPVTFLRVLQVTGGFAIATKIVFWSGLLISTPFLVVIIARFVFPGLTLHERRSVIRALLIAAVLFAAGACLSFFTTLPMAIRIMVRASDWLGVPCEFVELGDYVGFSLLLLLAFGLAFELPVVVLLLGTLHIVTSTQLREKRRHAIVILLIIAMFLTPPDVISQLLMGIPMILLFEACIWILHVRERRERAAGLAGR